MISLRGVWLRLIVFNVCLIFDALPVLISDISRVFHQLTEDNYFSCYLIPDLEEYPNDRFGGFR